MVMPVRSRQKWRSQPVFVSSTFRDMHAERDYLRTSVFPQLEERLNSRRGHLEPIDLRWGVVSAPAAEAEHRESLVLKVCLGEIERSRPFFLVLLGDRYGWVPPGERLRAAAREVGFPALAEGMSITELEVGFGALGAERRSRCFAFLRDPLPYSLMAPSTAADYSEQHATDSEAPQRHRALIRLKKEICATIPERVFRYAAGWDAAAQRVTGLESFGEAVLEQLWSALEEEFPTVEPESVRTWQDEDAADLERFVEARNRDFAGRVELLDRMRAFALSPSAEGAPWGMCLTGPPGSGKSSLLCRLQRLLESAGVIVLFHSTGVGPFSASVDRLLVRWSGQLAAALGQVPPFDESARPEEIDNAFASLLGKSALRGRVVVLLDALDQFEPTIRARHLTWFPKLFPPNARLIASSRSVPDSPTFQDTAGVITVAVPSLGAQEIEGVVGTICGRHHRTLPRESIETLMGRLAADGRPAAGNPLWLELALEELHLLDQDDFLRAERMYGGSGEERIARLLLDTVRELPADGEGLYGWLIGRAERLWGQAWTRALLALVAISRGGWREADLAFLVPAATGVPWDSLRFAAFRRAFRAHLACRTNSGQWTFAHAPAVDAVRRRYPDPGGLQALHALCADYLLGLPADDPLRCGGPLYHLLGADDRTRAASHYAGDLTPPEVLGATEVLTAILLAGDRDEVERVLSLPGLPGLGAPVRISLCRRYTATLTSLLAREASSAVRLRVLAATEAALEALLREFPAEESALAELARARFYVGVEQKSRGALAEALAAYHYGLEAMPALGARAAASPDRLELAANGNRGVAAVHLARGNLNEALAHILDAIDCWGRLTLEDPDNSVWNDALATDLGTLSGIYRAQGNRGETLSALRRMHEVQERQASLGSGQDWKSQLLPAIELRGQIAELCEEDGALAEALAGYRSVLEVQELVVQADPADQFWRRNLVVYHVRCGDVRGKMGDPAGAAASYRQGLPHAQRLVAVDPACVDYHRDLAVLHQRIGVTCRRLGDPESAVASYRIGREILERLVRALPAHEGLRRDLALFDSPEGAAGGTEVLGDLGMP